MTALTLHPGQSSLCLLCFSGVAQPALQVCESCEAQILDHIPHVPALQAASGLEAEDLRGPIFLAYPAWQEVCGMTMR